MNTKSIITELAARGFSGVQLSSWEEVLAVIPADSLSDIYQFIIQVPHAAEILTKSIVVKEAALVRGDLDEWQRALSGDTLVIKNL